jgi:predicted GIY-YIG superfamily endonuclease
MKKPNGYWNYEMCKETSLKFKTKKELKENSKSCYTTILSKKWYDLMDHMPSIGDLYNRCVYVYEFTNNYAYVGLTFNLEKRNKQHRVDKFSSVYKFIIETNTDPILIKLSDYIINSKAVDLELKTIEEYTKKGWKLLNKVKGGSLGATKRYWTKEKCIEEGLKYNSKKEFREKSYSSYKISLRNNWLPEVTFHMVEARKSKGFWSKENCHEEALKYKSKSDMIKNSPNCYKISLRNNWLEEVTKHMIETRRPKGFWTKENCHEEALKYKSKTEFRKNSYNCYKISQRKNWLEEITKHIKQ